MTNKVRWNVSAGKYEVGKGWKVNKNYATQADARRMAAHVFQTHPEYGRPIIRRMEISSGPGTLGEMFGGAVSMETKQFAWPPEKP